MARPKNTKAVSSTNLLIEWLYGFCKKQSAWSGIAGAFLTGVFVNTVSDPNIHNLTDLLSRIFTLKERPINILSWVAVITMIFLTLGKHLLGRYLSKQSFGIQVAKVFEEKVTGPAENPLFHEGRIAWGSCITLQSCPDIRSGWPVAEVAIQYSPTFHTIPKDVEQPYQNYIKTEFNKNFNDDRTRLMLTKNPIAFTDAPTLRLEVKQTKWSQIQFYKSWMWKIPSKLEENIEQILNGSINVPNSLALLLVVATSDGFILLTRTTTKAAYSPNLWACSIGEHLDLNDLKGTKKNYALNWFNRALSEELGIDETEYRSENARIMAVILETEIVNCALVGVVELTVSRTELDARLNKGLREDYEASQRDYIHWSDLADELMNNTKRYRYHPSTGLRMLYAGIYKYGTSDFTRQLLAVRKLKK